jgi:hypothetical protein
MKPPALFLSLYLGLFTTAAWAALKPGDPAPEFTKPSHPQGHRARWVIYESPRICLPDRNSLRIFGVCRTHRGIGFEENSTDRSVRDDLVQQRRDGNHRALGGKPETAQSFQMLERPHRNRPRRTA